MSRTWIVAYDFSDCSRAALTRAVQWLTQLGGGHLVVAHTEGYDLGAAGADLVVGTGAGVMLEQDAANKAELGRHVAAMAAQAPGVTLEAWVEFGRPAEQLAQLASERKAEVIVVGTHGRRGLERMLLGSVADQIVRLAPCDVMVVKS